MALVMAFPPGSGFLLLYQTPGILATIPSERKKQSGLSAALLLYVQIQIVQLADDFLLPLVEQQFLVVGEILLAAVAADEVGAVGADGQLRHQNQDLLALAVDVFAEAEDIGQGPARIVCPGF